MANQNDLFAPVQDENIVLPPCQSLALRRMIEALKADDAIYGACPEIVRRAIADILLPPYTSTESQIVALEEANAGGLKLLERFGDRIRELEGKVARRAA